MTETQQVFLEIIKDYLHGQKQEYSISDDLLRYAKTHEVQAILYKQTKCQELRSAYIASLYIYENRQVLIDGIREQLRDYDFFIVKGSTVAQYYPDPPLRTMGDIDIVVHYCDKEIVANILQSAGFTLTSTCDGAEWHLSKNRLDFELHHALLYGSKYTNKFVEYFSDCFEHVNNHCLEPMYQFLFLLVHLRKHLMSFGVGFRQFMDLAVFFSVIEDWQSIERELAKMQITEFAGVVFELIYRWWGKECPLRKNVTDSFFEEATNAIFENGVLGFENKNRIQDSIIAYDNRQGIQNTFYRIFPPISTLQNYSEYNFLKKSRILYPVAVIKHFFDYIWNRFAYKKQHQDCIPDNEYKHQRMEYLAQWGLCNNGSSQNADRTE